MGRGSSLNYSKIIPWHLKWYLIVHLDDIFIYHWHFVLIIQKRDGYSNVQLGAGQVRRGNHIMLVSVWMW